MARRTYEANSGAVAATKLLTAGFNRATDDLASGFVEKANAANEEINDLESQVDTNMASYDSLAELMNLGLNKTNYTADDLMNINEGGAAGRIVGAAGEGALEGVSMFGPWGAFKGLADGLSAAIGYGIGRAGAQKAAQQLNQDASIANQHMLAKMQTAALNIGKNMRNAEELNIAAFGGPLDTDFTNGVRFITEGGTHEQNPFGGVFQGIAMDGADNLVEEGEVIYDDYVYSARLKVPEADKKLLGLKKDKDYTYAEAADILQKESEERPNDPISKANLDDMMGRLQVSQETLKQKQQGQKLKRALNKMTPDELNLFMQQLTQPQQMQPMLAMQGMQPMQPTQGEVPMFKLGGHLFAKGGSQVEPILSYSDYMKRYPSATYDSEEAYKRAMYDMWGEDYVNSILDTDSPASSWNTTAGYTNPKVTTPESDTTKKSKKFSWGQAARFAPIVGSLMGSIASMFDKPNYSNIARAERAMRRVPRVAPGYVGQRLGYNPLDINFLMTQTANQGLGARRALVESGAGPQSIIASNYMTQLGMGQNFMQALAQNEARKAQVAGFNRETDTTNITNNLNADLQNQRRAMMLAQFMLQTGQLRDQEIGRVQANRNAQLTNLFNNIGAWGQDRLSREQLAAAIDAGVFGNLGENEAAYRRPLVVYGKKGGPLFTIKKGGKHA